LKEIILVDDFSDMGKMIYFDEKELFFFNRTFETTFG
jgi:hypothetical protein